MKYVQDHIFGSSWRRRFPWQRSPSLDLCGAGSALCNTAHLQGTGPGTGPGSALWPLGTHTQLTSLNKHIERWVYLVKYTVITKGQGTSAACESCMSGVFSWAFMIVHVRHSCWGQPQLVLLSGISSSSSPCEKTEWECWLHFICKLCLSCSGTLLDNRLLTQLFFFADLPQDRRGERYLHIGILRAINRKKWKDSFWINLLKNCFQRVFHSFVLIIHSMLQCNVNGKRTAYSMIKWKVNSVSVSLLLPAGYFHQQASAFGRLRRLLWQPLAFEHLWISKDYTLITYPTQPNLRMVPCLKDKVDL